MDVIIRTDASSQIGSGHVMRCLTIAKKLRAEGCHVMFWMEPLEGNLIDFVSSEGFNNCTAAQYADLYIVDHYELGIKWEQSIRPFTKKIMVIDDLARLHDCDLLLDQNFVPEFESRYDNKVPAHCQKLLGPKYLILRDEFYAASKKISVKNTPVQNLLVFMGGSDPTAETLKVLQALKGSSIPTIHIVVGQSNLCKHEIEQKCSQNGYHFHCQIDNLAELIAQADFGIGAGGMAMWERNFLHLPSTATIVADNQKITTKYAAEKGFVYNLGWHENITFETYKSIIYKLEQPKMLYKHNVFLKGINKDLWLDEIIK